MTWAAIALTAIADDRFHGSSNVFFLYCIKWASKRGDVSA